MDTHCHIAQERYVLAEPRELPQPKGPAEHAHVCVDTAEQHVHDAARLEHIPHLTANVADVVPIVIDRQRSGLVRDGAWIQPCLLEYAAPGGMLRWRVVPDAASVASLIHRVAM